MRFTIRLRKILLCNSLYVLLAVIAIIYAFVTVYLVENKSIYQKGNTTIKGVIEDIKIKDGYLRLEVNANEKVLVNYYQGEQLVQLGDTVQIAGEMRLPRNSALFNYEQFLMGKKIKMTMTSKEVTITKSNQSILYHIKNFIREKINNSPAKEYLNAFILGDTSFIDDEVIVSYRKNGISHLLAISGMHISLFANFLLFIFKKLKVKEGFRYLFVILFLLFYIFLVSYTPSALRSTFFFILLAINKYFFLNIKPINLMLAVLFIILLINPYYICHVGFQFSYTISFCLILFGNKITGGKMKTLFLTSLLSFLAGLPILINNYYEVNFLNVFFNLLFVPLVTTIIFPLSILSFFVPFLEYGLIIVTGFMEMLSKLCMNINFAQLPFMKPSLLIFCLYYIVVVIALRGLVNKKIRLMLPLLILMIGHYFYPFFDSSSYLLMIDVGQGDSFLLKTPYNQENILIDTGGKLTTSGVVFKNTLDPLFKALGINKFKYLILTHGDEDHLGEAKDIVDHFKVDNVIMNSGHINTSEQNLIKRLENRQIKYYFLERGHILRVANWKLEFLNKEDARDENKDSLVFLMSNEKYQLLFTGDINILEEEELVKSNLLSKIDLLKIAHHGSKGSTSDLLLEATKPEYALISVGEFNNFGHPSPKVLSKLDERGIKTYLTKDSGTVKIEFKERLLLGTLRF